MALMLDECHDYMTRWFCGHSAECRDPRDPDAALQLAKRHVLDQYVHVGVLEDLPNTVQLFRLRLPDFFAGDPAHTPDEADFPELHSAKTLAKRSGLKKNPASSRGGPKTKSAPLSAANLDRLKEANRRDIALYEFILDLHRRRVEICLVGADGSSRRGTPSWPPPLGVAPRQYPDRPRRRRRRVL
mmetsp:Transcript_15548/g.62593  ORF Transcript_15548/g.62593 Transcript_15548/m.62593 type:complete len:186 (-) Transcript_15548:66-623(-)